MLQDCKSIEVRCGNWDPQRDLKKKKKKQFGISCFCTTSLHCTNCGSNSLCVFSNGLGSRFKSVVQPPLCGRFSWRKSLYPSCCWWQTLHGNSTSESTCTCTCTCEKITNRITNSTTALLMCCYHSPFWHTTVQTTSLDLNQITVKISIFIWKEPLGVYFFLKNSPDLCYQTECIKRIVTNKM